MRICFTLILALIGFSSLSQNQPSWTLYKTIAGIEVYYQQANCTTDQAPAQVAYILKFVNTTQASCKVSWDLSVWYNNEKQTHDIADGENHHVITLEAGRTVEGSCDVPYGPFYIWKDFITYVSPTKLTKFELENIEVSKL